MTYEYVCVGCHHEWEAEQSISAKPLDTCPNCGEKTAKRQVSGGSGFILKGGGWYADGYTAKKPAGSSDKGSSESKATSEKTPKPAESSAPASKESAPAPKESVAPATP
jgi:putative FmdB family regulatory protein